jgi:Methyltransferase domain
VVRLRREKDSDLVPRGPHSPIPDVAALPDALWERPSPLRGVAFDREAQQARLAELGPELAAFPAIDGFRLDNGYYEAFDAEVLWALLRTLRPRAVVELGSGWSSLVIAAALRANGGGARYDVFDPLPREPAAPGVQRVAAQDVPDDVFTALGSGDVLFVDTTHTVKTGGDVNRIVLAVLPLLAPGVLVHFHDVLLPWELHRTWLERGWFWFEQYLLQAFLSGNRDWEVLLGLHDLTKTAPELVRRLVPSWTGDTYPSAFWIRRCHPS